MCNLIKAHINYRKNVLLHYWIIKFYYYWKLVHFSKLARKRNTVHWLCILTFFRNVSLNDDLHLLSANFVRTVYEIHLLALSTLPMNRIMHEAGPVDRNWWNPVVINRLQRECNKRQTEIIPNKWILIIFSASLQWYLDIRFRSELGFCYCPFSILFWVLLMLNE